MTSSLYTFFNSVGRICCHRQMPVLGHHGLYIAPNFVGFRGFATDPAGRLRSPPTDPQICGAMPAAPQPTAASDSGDHKSPHSGGGPKSPPSLPPESAPECKDTRSCCIIKINKMKTLKSALCGELWGCFLKGAPRGPPS